MKAEELKDKLTKLLVADPMFLSLLIDHKIEVNPEKFKETSLVCATMEDPVKDGEQIVVSGMLGVLNSLLDDEDYIVAAVYIDDSGMVAYFTTVPTFILKNYTSVKTKASDLGL